MKDSAACPDDIGALGPLTKAGQSAIDGLLQSLGELAKLLASENPLLKALETSRRRASCEIPPACWLPRTLGEMRSVACPGAAASLRIRVTNCQPRASNVKVAFAKPSASASVTPESATLGPMERAWFTASVSVPADAAKCSQIETLVWVLGCNSHYLRWIVDVRDITSGSCHEIEVEDCPDYVHHWYDHFYCNRHCFHAGRTDAAG